MTRLSTVVWPWMFSVLSCLLAGRNWVAHPSTATYSNQNNCVCVSVCVFVWFSRLFGFWTGDRSISWRIYIYICLFYNSIYMYYIPLCVQAGPLFSPTCFTYSKSISYSQHDFRDHRHRCKHSQMLPRRYSYVQLRQQIAYVGSTSQACIFLPRDVPVIANWDLFFLNWMMFLLIELNQIIQILINTCCWFSVSQGKLSDWRLYGTLGFDSGVLDAGQTHWAFFDWWTRCMAKGPRKCPSLCSEPTAVPDRSSHSGHFLGHTVDADSWHKGGEIL